MTDNDRESADLRPKLKVTAPGREFVLPYVERELPGYKIISEGTADCCVNIVEPGADSAGGETVLVCPNIVGTGMTGLPMEIARRIAGGSYFHISGNEARLSTVHAVDVAKAVSLVLHTPGVYLLTDGYNPTYAEFAEALAWRIKQKRIFTVSPFWSRWLMNRAFRRIVTTDSVLDGSEFINRFGFKPNVVTEYLRTHVYDDESL